MTPTLAAILVTLLYVLIPPRAQWFDWADFLMAGAALGVVEILLAQGDRWWLPALPLALGWMFRHTAARAWLACGWTWGDVLGIGSRTGSTPAGTGESQVVLPDTYQEQQEKRLETARMLAGMKHNEKYIFSANEICAKVGGARSDVLAEVRKVRPELQAEAAARSIRRSKEGW